MKCTICEQDSNQPNSVTVTVQRGDVTIIMKDVPRHMCDDGGEYLLNEDVWLRIMEYADRATTSGTEVVVMRFAA